MLASNRVVWVEQLREVAMIRHLGEVVGQDGGRERIDLAERHGLPSERAPGDGGSLDPGAD